MKKNFIGIFFAIIAIIAVALIVLMLNYKKGISKPEISDAAKFKDEYVSLIRQYKENIWNPKFNENDIAEFIKENTWDKRGEFIRERLEVLL